MNIKEYIRKSERTCPSLGSKELNLVHMALGIGTESGEIQDCIKKFIAYGVDLDVVNIQEEIGDLMWYLANLSRMLDMDFEEILRINIDKLHQRYGGGFSEERAVLRDLEAELKILGGDEVDVE